MTKIYFRTRRNTGVRLTAAERERLKARRESLGMTRRELAARIGVTDARMRQMEHGLCSLPSRAVVVRWERVVKGA